MPVIGPPWITDANSTERDAVDKVDMKEENPPLLQNLPHATDPVLIETDPPELPSAFMLDGSDAIYPP
ncbi:hypothetical protein GX48_00853 [Paracoccidioides brasiliensis]|nr:hypothetical protein GX48_00853 [Paracoccidioides brasiliensis]